MRLVWSFWSKPYEAFYQQLWGSERYHWFAWVISVMSARRVFPDFPTALITDDAGARRLIDQLGLPFDTCSTCLNDYHDADPDWWVLGKLRAYHEQTEPFLHLDSDVFLWKPLPTSILTSPVIGQNPEVFDWQDNWLYDPRKYADLCHEGQGWLPNAFHRFVEQQGNYAVNCGIVGGSDIDLFHDYSAQAICWIRHPRNKTIWASQTIDIGSNILAEQYFLAACIAQRYPHISDALSCLFASIADSSDPAQAETLGYTHLIGGAKRNPSIQLRMLRRMMQDFPDYYQRVLEMLTVC